MEFENINWDDLTGGYKTSYNPIEAFYKIKSSNPIVVKSGFEELWENLHHQGDVGTASYYSVPILIKLCVEEKSLDWNFIGLCVIIENCRHSLDNPILPSAFEVYYNECLLKFETYLLSNFKKIKDEDSLKLTFAFLATNNGYYTLGKALEEF